MGKFTTLHGVSSSYDMNRQMHELESENPFSLSVSGANPAVAPVIDCKAFRDQVLAMLYGNVRNIHPQSALNAITFSSDKSARMFWERMNRLFVLPTGAMNPNKCAALLQEWGALICKASIYFDDFYSAQFFAELQAIVPPKGKLVGIEDVSDKAVSRLCTISELYACANAHDFCDPLLLFTIVACAYMRIHETILVPYIPDLSENISDIVSKNPFTVHEAWRKMRFVKACHVPAMIDYAKEHQYLCDWDSTGVLRGMLQDNKHTTGTAAIWAVACHRYGFEK